MYSIIWKVILFINYPIIRLVICCLFQTMQKSFGLVRCICQYRYVIGVVGVGNCCCWVSSASFLRQLEAIIAILANTPDQAETLLHSLERAAASIGLYVNAHKTEYMCYNQTGDISTLEGTPLKLVDKFTYRGSSVESTEKDIETRLKKAWTAINRLSIIWKSDLTDKMKRSFFQAAVTSILLYGCTT